MRISDWSSDVCSSDHPDPRHVAQLLLRQAARPQPVDQDAGAVFDVGRQVGTLAAQFHDGLLSADGVPRHVAIIMDGNRRWAKKRLLPRVAGHRAGVEAVRKVTRGARALGIEALTLYAFSSANSTGRPPCRERWG